MFRVYVLAYSITTTSVIDLQSLCGIAKWVISQRQAEDGHFLEEGPVIMASMQVPTPPPPPELVKQNPGLCSTDREFQAPGLFSGRMRKGNSRGPAASLVSPCSLELFYNVKEAGYI